jgi:hypothetical protein
MRMVVLGVVADTSRQETTISMPVRHMPKTMDVPRYGHGNGPIFHGDGPMSIEDTKVLPFKQLFMGHIGMQNRGFGGIEVCTCKWLSLV